MRNDGWLTGAAVAAAVLSVSCARAEGRCEVRHPNPTAIAQAADRVMRTASALRSSSGVAVVDVLIGFDASGAAYAVERAGSVRAFAESCIARANACLPNTGLDAHMAFRLAGTVEVASRAHGVMEALDGLIDDYGRVIAKGEWRKVPEAREELGADVVSVLVDIGETSSGTIGIGYSMEGVSSPKAFADWAYNACSIRDVDEGHTLLHEIGHNMGCGHPDASCASACAMSLGPQLYDSSAGYFTWADGQGYYTIMGYNFGGLQPDGSYDPSYIFEPLPCFSSSVHTYEGLTIGTARNDNTYTLIQTCQAVSEFRKARKVDPEPPVYDESGLSCPTLASSVLMVGVGGSMSFPVLGPSTVKKLAAKGLPSGWKLVQDKKTRLYSLTGTPKKAFDGRFTLTATLTNGKKLVQDFDLVIRPFPDGLVGTFNGVAFDAGSGAAFGTFALTGKSGGKMTAKVVTASGTMSFSAKAWSRAETNVTGDMCVCGELETKTGDLLAVCVNVSAPWCEVSLAGELVTEEGETYGILASRNAYVKEGKIPADPGAAAFLADVLACNKGKYVFDARQEEDGTWTLTPSASKKPAVTVTVDKKGMAKLKGKLGKTSVSGTAQVVFADDGVAWAEFVFFAKVGKIKVAQGVAAELRFATGEDAGK